jgi:hypothetical protein
MGEVQCGKFESLFVDVDGMTRWSATLTPSPSEIWLKAFKDEAGAALSAGVSLGDTPLIRSDSIEFSAPENSQGAVASAIRGVITKTNRTATGTKGSDDLVIDSSPRPSAPRRADVGSEDATQ